MGKKILLFIFIFCNLYNPVSVYLTLVINLIFVIILSFRKSFTRFVYNKVIIFCTLLILIWLTIIIVIRVDIDSYVLGKYLRASISAFLISIICNEISDKLKIVVSTLKLVLLLHIAAIGAQMVFPQIELTMANFFGFQREADIISSFTVRKLGCSSSYDTAGLLSIVSVTLFSILYIQKRKAQDLLFSCVSLAACTMSSRTGMVLGFITYIMFTLILFFNSKGFQLLIPMCIVLFGLVVSYYLIIPVIAASTELLVGIVDTDPSIPVSYEYTKGTVEGLSISGAHFNALKIASLNDLIIGFGVDPNKIQGGETDIGYIKFIYHIGIVGLVLILILYTYMFLNLLKLKNRFEKSTEEYALTYFTLTYIILLIFMNYKSLEIYSRGGHDLIVILFCALSLTRIRRA